MTDGKELAHAQIRQNPWDGGASIHGGLTKREYFAAAAMQGLISKQSEGRFSNEDGVTKAAQWSVEYADALIEALNAK